MTETGSHVVMYWPGFGALLPSQSLKACVDHLDDLHVANLVEKMSNLYELEKDRMRIMRDCMGQYFDRIIEATEHKNTVTDGCLRALTKFGNIPLVILEGKNELGSGGCEPLQQSISMYCHLLQECKSIIEVCNAPCLLIQLVGPYIFAYGCVHVGLKLHVDLLDQVCMLHMPDDPSHLEKLVCFWHAVKTVISSLVAYYTGLGTSVPTRAFTQLAYPSVCPEVTFTAAIKRNVFRGNLADGQAVIVKIVPRYGQAAHVICQQYAPALLACREVPGTYFWVVIMSDLTATKEGTRTLGEFLTSAKHAEKEIVRQQCRAALALLHQENFVHGDFRTCNILVFRENGAPRIALIDFDWSEKEGIASYPFFLNRVDIIWPAHPRGKIKKEHDLAWLEVAFGIQVCTITIYVAETIGFLCFSQAPVGMEV